MLRPAARINYARAAIPTDLADPRAGEGMIDVRELGVRGENYYARTDGENAPYGAPIAGAIDGLFLRREAALRLATADAALKLHGRALFIHDGYRPLSAQHGLWRHFRDGFARREPAWSDAELDAATATFVSDPRAFDRADPHRLPPLHATGGAVDLTMTDAAGEVRDLGSGFDDPGEAAATAYFEAALHRREIAADDPRLLDRRILYWALREAGFTNYLHEWWHYDYGNQMHVLTAALLGEPVDSGSAWYGYVERDARP